MAQNKHGQQAIREQLLRDGSVRSSFVPSSLRTKDSKSSRENAIAARRQELQHNNKRGA